MPLPMAKPNQSYRLLGYIVWCEDLERIGKTYGDLLGFLSDLHIACVVSPIHDRDRYTKEDVEGWKYRHTDSETHVMKPEDEARIPEEGSAKKAHIHVYWSLSGSRKPTWLCEYLNLFYPDFFNPRRFAAVPDWGKIVRYCAHMDSPNKAQYSPFDVIGFSNADLHELNDVKNEDSVGTLLEIENAIADNHIENYYRLNVWVNSTENTSWIRMVKGRTSHFVQLFNARRQEKIDAANKRKAEQERQRNRAQCAGIVDEHGELFIG